MGYLCDLGDGQSVYLENLHNQTRVTVSSSYAGQQQQSSSGFQTGPWTAPPELFQAAIGVLAKLYTEQGERCIQIQGTHLGVLHEAPSWAEAQRLPMKLVDQKPLASMPPMPPMQPMTLGNMQIDRGAMSMQMGNMRMSMTPIAQSPSDVSQASAAAPAAADGQRKFCSQCGKVINPGDRFCAHCGHRLD